MGCKKLVNPDVVTAFFAGIGSVLGGVLTVRHVRKLMREECAEKLALFERGLDRGAKKDG